MNIEIWWDDLTDTAKTELKKKGIYHDNISLSPLAIIELEVI